MNPMVCCAVVAALAWSNVAFAGVVELQNFDHPVGSSAQFVLQPQRAQHPDVPVTPNAIDDLGRAFDSLADRDPEARPPRDDRKIGPIGLAAAGHSNWRRPQSDTSSLANCPSEIYRPNPALPASAELRRATWYPAVVAAACEAGLPALLLDALVIQESRYNPTALSPKGAAGISQLMPDRARLLGVRDVWNPLDNLRGGARHLRALLDEFGRFDLALAAYNAGEGRVRRRLTVPRIPETLGYVSGVLLTMRNELSRRTRLVSMSPH